MENAPKDGLDRMISIRSTEGDSYLDKHAGLISPQGEPPGQNSRLCRGSGCDTKHALHFSILLCLQTTMRFLEWLTEPLRWTKKNGQLCTVTLRTLRKCRTIAQNRSGCENLAKAQKSKCRSVCSFQIDWLVCAQKLGPLQGWVCVQEDTVLAKRVASDQPIHYTLRVVVCICALHRCYLHSVCCSHRSGVQHFFSPVGLGWLL